MKQKKLLITLLIGIAFISSSYKAIAKSTKKSSTNKVVQNSTRFGSDKVGYVNRDSKWINFNDPNSSANAKQMTLDGVNIITLDIIAENANIDTNQLAEFSSQRYINSGVPARNISKRDITINGYKGTQVNIKFPDGTVFIINYIKHNNNIYFISQEGTPEYQSTLSSVVNTWKPTK